MAKAKEVESFSRRTRILPAPFLKSRVFVAERPIGGQLRMKFHNFEIILPVDKKINPLHRSNNSR
ncbi:hypothetical protein WNY39_11800 [Sulfitobacter sp. AS59]